jgi:hypothetical protein
MSGYTRVDHLLSSRTLRSEEALYSALRRHDSLLQQQYTLGKVHGPKS